MESDIEMDTSSKRTTPALPCPDTSSEQIFDKTAKMPDAEGLFTSNGKPRSKIRMFAILTALFVRSRPPSYFLFSAKPLPWANPSSSPFSLLLWTQQSSLQPHLPCPMT
jgi:hypothetical protein